MVPCFIVKVKDFYNVINSNCDFSLITQLCRTVSANIFIPFWTSSLSYLLLKHKFLVQDSFGSSGVSREMELGVKCRTMFQIFLLFGPLSSRFLSRAMDLFVSLKVIRIVMILEFIDTFYWHYAVNWIVTSMRCRQYLTH